MLLCVGLFAVFNSSNLACVDAKERTCMRPRPEALLIEESIIGKGWNVNFDTVNTVCRGQLCGPRKNILLLLTLKSLGFDFSIY
mgnify:CR=1 FL=1